MKSYSLGTSYGVGNISELLNSYSKIAEVRIICDIMKCLWDIKYTHRESTFLFVKISDMYIKTVIILFTF